MSRLLAFQPRKAVSSFTPSLLTTTGRTFSALGTTTWTSPSTTYPAGRMALAINGYWGGPAITGITIKGVAAVKRQSSDPGASENGSIWDAVVTSGSGTIVVTFSSAPTNAQIFITVWDIGSFVYKSGVSYSDGSFVTTRDLGQNTVAGNAMFAVTGWVEGTPYTAATNLTKVTHSVTMDAGYSFWYNYNTSGGTPEAFAVNCTSANEFYIAAALYGL